MEKKNSRMTRTNKMTRKMEKDKGKRLSGIGK